MMVIGMAGLTEQQNRAHMSLWAISGGPLLLGADLTKLTVADLTTLTNADVVRIDQDSLGLQSVKVAEPAPGLEVWAKPLSTSGERAVLLLNRTAAPAPIVVHWSELGLQDDSLATVRDVWAGSELGELPKSYSATVPAQDAVLLLVLGGEGPMTAYFPDEHVDKPVDKPVLEKDKVAPPKPTTGKDLALTFSGVVSKFPVARVRMVYSNPDKLPRFAELRVNGQGMTRIAFPSTGGEGATGILSIESRLEAGGAKNVLTVLAVHDPGPVIQSISLQ
jgi:hypothetical protein